MKSNYEERKQNRIAAYENLAAKNENLSDNLFKKSGEMASVIPFGQPILVGHHSEKRDRNYRNKIHNTMGAAVAAHQKAKYYQGRVESLLSNNAISSDDPNAIDKLTEKLERLEGLQELMKDANKIIKRAKKTDAEKVADLVKMGFSESRAASLLIPDYARRVGFPSFKITNNGATIRNVKDRIEHLKKIAAIETTEETINGVILKINAEENRVQLIFDGKPSDEVRTKLKKSGFRFCYTEMAWQRQISNWAIYEAKNILNNL